jgi:hypothetical protein
MLSASAWLQLSKQYMEAAEVDDTLKRSAEQPRRALTGM